MIDRVQRLGGAEGAEDLSSPGSALSSLGGSGLCLDPEAARFPHGLAASLPGRVVSAEPGTRGCLFPFQGIGLRLLVLQIYSIVEF